MKKTLSLFIVLICFASPFVGAAQTYMWKFPAIYVFGDSTVDVGNNNYLRGSRAKANFPHYGIDFPRSRPTGRFSNGFNVIDFIATYMGFSSSPPSYLSLNNANNRQIMKGLRGVNFASAGSGILDSTGTAFITMTQQVRHFEALRSKMAAQPNAHQVALSISKSLFVISSGGNDVFAFIAQEATNDTAVPVFYKSMVSKFEIHIKTLYRLGARKFAVNNVAFIGCVPGARALNPTGGCIDGLNQLAKGLNDAVAALIRRLSVALPGFEYSIGNTYEVLSSFISRPLSFGFREVKSACCGAGKFKAQSFCTPNSTYCMNRHQYVFWDALHPTQATCKLGASLLYNGPAQFVGPITYKQLAEK